MRLKKGSSMKFPPGEEWLLPVSAMLIRHFTSDKQPFLPIETRFIEFGKKTAMGVSFK
jgi:hypothetical protein